VRVAFEGDGRWEGLAFVGMVGRGLPSLGEVGGREVPWHGRKRAASLGEVGGREVPGHGRKRAASLGDGR
jgi:hypothetical protein